LFERRIAWAAAVWSLLISHVTDARPSGPRALISVGERLR
jgi:hypothetical protein